MYIYSLRDEMAGYGELIKFPSDEFRKRAFETELANPESMINHYRKDYSIWRIGEFDTAKGEFINLEKYLIARGEQYKED